jgi:hypothetical protein
MAHLKLRSITTRMDSRLSKGGRQTLVDKVGRTFGKYESITDATRAAKLISGTSEVKPRRKPK